MKFGILTDLDYVINFVKFGYGLLQGWGLVSSQILGFCLHLRSRPNTALRYRACCDGVSLTIVDPAVTCGFT